MEARLVLLRSFTNLLPESKNTRHDFRPDGSCGLLRTLSLLRDCFFSPLPVHVFTPFFITRVSTRLDKPVFSFGADDGCDSFGFEWLSTWMGSPAFCPPPPGSRQCLPDIPPLMQSVESQRKVLPAPRASSALRYRGWLLPSGGSLGIGGCFCEAKSSRSPDGRCLKAFYLFHL